VGSADLSQPAAQSGLAGLEGVDRLLVLFRSAAPGFGYERLEPVHHAVIQQALWAPGPAGDGGETVGPGRVQNPSVVVVPLSDHPVPQPVAGVHVGALDAVGGPEVGDDIGEHLEHAIPRGATRW